jgi:tRNA G18 (ribose-2'-O)-methylase SpoU
MLVPIDDADDPRIEAFRDIRERDLKGRGGRFVIEGEVVLRTALSRGRFALESILIGENRLAPLADLVAALPEGVPAYVASRPVLDRIAGFPLHRGILGMGLRGAGETVPALIGRLPAKALVLVLSGIANHDNAGGLFRNAAAFGVDAVFLDAGCCDPLYRKAIRVSAGAALTVPFAAGDALPAILDRLADEGFQTFATSPAGRTALIEAVPAPRTAVLVGAEGPGLPRDILERLDSLRIDIAAGVDSLNVATASAIVLHHLARR